MVLLHLGTLLLLASVHCQPHKRQADEDTPGEEECCDQKMVGDDRYFNIGYDHNGMTWDLNCLSPCIFEKEDQPGSKYCFAAGDMKVECEDDMEYTPTGGPRPTEGPGGNEATGGPGGPTEDGPDGGNGVTTDGGPAGGVTGDGGPGTSNGTCRCGIKKTQRIVGGNEAEVNEYPWIAVFGDSDGDNLGGCSSTLIGNNWAVTAAHCFFDDTNQQNKFKDDLTVVLGVHDRTIVVTPDTPLSERKVMKISEIVLHPDYNQATSSSNDIALLKFTESVELEKYTPACLAEEDADYTTGQTGWVYGWGVTSESGSDLAEKLQELEVPIVSDAVCRPAMEGEGVSITDDMLCAGGQEGKDSCGGDSGGPFTVDIAGVHTLAGVVSFGIGCARDGLYGVYAEVAKFRGWIDETIKDKDASAVFCN